MEIDFIKGYIRQIVLIVVVLALWCADQLSGEIFSQWVFSHFPKEWKMSLIPFARFIYQLILFLIIIFFTFDLGKKNYEFHQPIWYLKKFVRRKIKQAEAEVIKNAPTMDYFLDWTSDTSRALRSAIKKEELDSDFELSYIKVMLGSLDARQVVKHAKIFPTMSDNHNKAIKSVYTHAVDELRQFMIQFKSDDMVRDFNPAILKEFE